MLGAFHYAIVIGRFTKKVKYVHPSKQPPAQTAKLDFSGYIFHLNCEKDSLKTHSRDFVRVTADTLLKTEGNPAPEVTFIGLSKMDEEQAKYKLCKNQLESGLILQ